MKQPAAALDRSESRDYRIILLRRPTGKVIPALLLAVMDLPLFEVPARKLPMFGFPFFAGIDIFLCLD